MFEAVYIQPKSKRSIFRWKFLIGIIIGVILGGGVFSAVSVISIGQTVYPDDSVGEILGNFSKLVIASDRPLDGEEKREVTVMLLGVGGNGYYGKIVTDTIILMTIRPADEPGDSEVVLLSIPRDLWVEVPEISGSRKINEAFKYGELREEGQGYAVLSEVLEAWTGIGSEYYAVGNFEAFESVIDAVGGVDVEVDRAFTDYSYPDGNLGYLSPLTFEEGSAHLDGEKALRFARSRHGTNGEGTDFARSKRQQKIIVAFKERLSRLDYLMDISTIKKLAEIIAGSFNSNFEPWEAKRLYDLTKDIPRENFYLINLDPATTGLLCGGTDEETQLYAIKICDGYEMSDLRQFVENRFEFGRELAED